MRHTVPPRIAGARQRSPVRWAVAVHRLLSFTDPGIPFLAPVSMGVFREDFPLGTPGGLFLLADAALLARPLLAKDSDSGLATDCSAADAAYFFVSDASLADSFLGPLPLITSTSHP
jgi:hypothetical protein